MLLRSQEEAKRLNHKAISEEALLLALLQQTEGVAAKVLINLGVDLERVSEAVESSVKRGEKPFSGQLRLSSFAKKVIESAVGEALSLKHHYIGTEHLLIAMLMQGRATRKILTSFGVDLDAVRSETTRFLRDPENVRPLLLEIAGRCEASGIEFEPTPIEEGTTSLIMSLPAGRTKKALEVRGRGPAESLLSIPFERIRGIDSYKAICSYEDSYIEAALDVHTKWAGTSYLQTFFGYDPESNSVYDWLLTHLKENEALEGESRIESLRIYAKSDEERFGNTRISIGIATTTFEILHSLHRGGLELLGLFESPHDRRRIRTLTIRIDGVSISRHDQAKAILETIVNSILFRLDLLLGWKVYLALEKEARVKSMPETQDREKVTLGFPKYQYDPEPMALFWYARRADELPLVQYLAYYQVIEFHFPAFVGKETQQAVRRMLKDPSFDPERDMDIGRLLSSVTSRVKGGYGDERSALLSTLRECVTHQDLEGFFNEDDERLEFFGSKESTIISSKRITVRKGDVDLVSQTAERVYDVRSKIVHTKSADSGDQRESILPFSKEAQQLGHDIELVEFLARRVLVATGTPLVISP